MSTPFLIFPWDAPFLPHLTRVVCDRTEGCPGNAIIIVPHNRARRYLVECFRQDAALPRPTLLPRMLTVREMIDLFRAETTALPLHTAHTLDRVALLYHGVQDVALQQDDAELCQRFAGMEISQFFPWGLRLASVLEECLTQGIDVRDIPYTEGEVLPLASALLGALGRIQQRYLALLEERQWTTPGLDACVAAREVASGACATPRLLRLGDGRQVFLAGLAVLTHTENVLLHHLWQEGAHICLHTDPALADPDNTTLDGHWACTDHIRWIRQWNAPRSAACPATGREPHLFFMAGHDAHSQLDAMRQTLLEAKGHPSTAIVLTDTGLLLPTLHHLPDQDFNVSMGYPLDRSPLCHLLEALLRMHSTRRPGGPGVDRDRYHWRALRHCLRHPCLRMLGTSEDPAGGSLRDTLHAMENALRQGTRFADPYALAEAVHEQTPTPLRPVLQRLLRCMVDNFARAQSPADMGYALRELCTLLLDAGGDTWKRAPLDAESLYRLVQRVIPELINSALADSPFPPAALYSLTRQLVRAQRVPFEADPIAGLQILGMLETRLLHFERVLVMDATDDILPGFTAHDPLLPDALRALLGLPDARRRERTTAHTLYRLMAGAAEVHFFWQEGIQRSGLLDGKKNRSRFVDECLWQEEKRRKAILETGTPPLRAAPCPVHPMPREAQGLIGSPALSARMREILDKGISPTRMDTYLTCSLRFAWEHLYRLRPPEEVNEGDDPAAVGELIHRVLCEVYTPWLHRTLSRGDIEPEQMGAHFAKVLDASPLRKQLPPDSYIMLATAGPLCLKRYLENQPEETEVVALETKLSATLDGGRFRLSGTVDRVDRRQGKLVVLDYKTGQVRRPPPDIWTDTALWRDLEQWTPDSAADPLPTLAERLPSVQLPFYMYICAAANLGPVGDAAWIQLRDTGKEVPLLGKDIPDTETTLGTTLLEQHIPGLLRFLLRHMEHATAFPPRQGGHCAFCPYTNLCLRPRNDANIV